MAAVLKDVEMKCVRVSIDEYTKDKKKGEIQQVRLAQIQSDQKLSQLIDQDYYEDRMSLNLQFNPGDAGYNAFTVGSTYKIQITAS